MVGVGGLHRRAGAVEVTGSLYGGRRAVAPVMQSYYQGRGTGAKRLDGKTVLQPAYQ